MSQDTSISLALITEAGEEKKGVVKIQQNNGNMTLSFYPELESITQNRALPKRIAQIADYICQVCDFRTITLDPDDRLRLTLVGCRSRCAFKFAKDEDVTTFIGCVSRRARLKTSDCNPLVYLFEPLDSVDPGHSTALPQSSTHANRAPGKESIQKVQQRGVRFESGEPVAVMTADAYRELFDAEGRVKESSGFPDVFYNKEIDFAVMGDVWKLLLTPENARKTAEERAEEDAKNRKKYEGVKRQWKITTPRQWKNDSELRGLVKSLETDLQQHKELFQDFTSPGYAQRIAFNVLMTLSRWDWDGAAYAEGMVTFLLPFLNSFVKDVDAEKVTRHDGSVVDVEVAESEIFWCFVKFFIHNRLCDLVRSGSQPLVKELFISIGYLLEDNFPEMLQLLSQKHAFSLDFLSSDCSRWFTTCFSGSDIRRLWASILTFPSSFQFLQCFVISLLFSLTPSLVEMNPRTNEQFVEQFTALKAKIDLNLILLNATKIVQLLKLKS